MFYNFNRCLTQTVKWFSLNVNHFYDQIKLFVTTYTRNNNVGENTIQAWLTLKEQSDQVNSFMKDSFFLKKWAFVHPAKISSVILSSVILSIWLLS